MSKLRDENGPALVPMLVFVNFALLLLTGLSGASTVLGWAFVPDRLTDAFLNGDIVGILHNLLTFVSYAFLHAGFDHYLSNMLLFLLFGLFVEREMGGLRLGGAYLVAAVAGAFGHYIFNLTSHDPLVGASGAIAGVLGAYMVVIFRRSRGVTPLTLLGAIFIVHWLVGQAFSAVRDFTVPFDPEDIHVAYLTHLAGFAGGLLVTLLLFRKQDPDDEGSSNSSTPPDNTEPRWFIDDNGDPRRLPIETEYQVPPTMADLRGLPPIETEHQAPLTMADLRSLPPYPQDVQGSDDNLIDV